MCPINVSVNLRSFSSLNNAVYEWKPVVSMEVIIFSTTRRRRHWNTFLPVGPHAEKFDIVKNDRVSRLIRMCRIQWWCSLFHFPPEIPILVKFGTKFKIVGLNWNLVPRPIWICKNQWRCFFVFLSKLLFLGKFDPKNQNSLRKLKFGTYINLNMWNSVVPFVLSVLVWKYSLGKFGPKN